MLARVRPVDGPLEAHEEWLKLLVGVANNQPEFIVEWKDISATKFKREFRAAFGSTGDRLRWAGWGALNIGPLTRAAIQRFCIKVGKALYYRYNNELFDGDMYITHVDPMIRHKDNKEYLDSIFQNAPLFAAPERNSQSLSHQFIYRYNHTAELGALYAVVVFGPQLVFPIMALRTDLAERLRSDLPEARKSGQTEGLFHCPLKVRSAPPTSVSVPPSPDSTSVATH